MSIQTATLMTRATLIHNPTAGKADASGDSLRALVADRGLSVRYATTDDDLDEVLQDPGDLVVAAGGDGTVGKVATRLVGRGVPLVVLALGTANNVARGLGLPVDGGTEAMAFDWSRATRRRLDVGVTRGPWGTRHFIESFGIGLFGHAMPILAALKKFDAPVTTADAMDHDRRALAALLDDYRPHPLRLTLDGQTRDGDYLMVEALNVPSIGANLRLAPGASPYDGRLELVSIGASDRRATRDWIAGGGQRRPPAPARRIQSLSFTWRGEPLHMDGLPWGPPTASYHRVHTARVDAQVVVALEPAGVPIVVPPE